MRTSTRELRAKYWVDYFNAIGLGGEAPLVTIEVILRATRRSADRTPRRLQSIRYDPKDETLVLPGRAAPLHFRTTDDQGPGVGAVQPLGDPCAGLERNSDANPSPRTWTDAQACRAHGPWQKRSMPSSRLREAATSKTGGSRPSGVTVASRFEARSRSATLLAAIGRLLVRVGLSRSSARAQARLRVFTDYLPGESADARLQPAS